MQKIAYRIILFILLSTIIVSTIGCQVNSPGDSLESSDYGMKKPEVTLTFYFPGTENLNAREVLDEVEKQTKDVLNIKLDFKLIAFEQYSDTIKNLLRSGGVFDGFFSSQIGLDGDMGKMAKEGLLLDISDIFSENAPHLLELYSKEELSQAEYNGKLMGIPFHYPISYRICSVVREDFIKKYNIPDIKDYKDYEVYLKIIKENEPGVVPGFCWSETLNTFAESFGYVTLCDHFVYEWKDSGMKLIPWEKTPEFRTAVDTYMRWHKNGYIDNSVPASKLMEEKRFSSVIENCMAAFYEQDTEVGTGYKLAVYPLYPDKTTRMVTDTYMICINKNSKNAERIIQLIDWIQSKQENYDLFMNGIKDKNYTLKENGQITTASDRDNYSGWFGSIAFLNFNYFRPNNIDPVTFKNQFSNITGLNARYAPSTGFIPETEAVGELIKQRETMYSTFEEELRNGKIDEINVDKFIKNQDNINGSLIELLQTQLNKWKADFNK